MATLDLSLRNMQQNMNVTSLLAYLKDYINLNLYIWTKNVLFVTSQNGAFKTVGGAYYMT